MFETTLCVSILYIITHVHVGIEYVCVCVYVFLEFMFWLVNMWWRKKFENWIMNLQLGH